LSELGLTPAKPGRKDRFVGSKKSTKQNPSHHATLPMLRRIKGQLEGVEKMIQDERQCPDILAQVRAVRGALKSLESRVIETRLRHVVKDAMLTSSVTRLNA